MTTHMATTSSSGSAHASRSRDSGGWLGRGLAAAGHGLVFCGLMIVETLTMTAVLLVTALAAVGVGLPLIPATAGVVRRLTNVTRRLSGRWCGAEIPAPAAAAAPAAGRPGDGPGPWWRAASRTLGDTATWRDLLWLTVDPLAGWFLALVPAALLAWGVFGLVMPAVWQPISDAHGNNWYAFIHVDGAAPAWASVPLGAATVVLAVAAGPWLLARYGRYARAVLAPGAGQRRSGPPTRDGR